MRNEFLKDPLVQARTFSAELHLGRTLQGRGVRALDGGAGGRGAAAAGPAALRRRGADGAPAAARGGRRARQHPVHAVRHQRPVPDAGDVLRQDGGLRHGGDKRAAGHVRVLWHVRADAVSGRPGDGRLLQRAGGPVVRRLQLHGGRASRGSCVEPLRHRFAYFFRDSPYNYAK
jgi:hypothetical protein